MYFISTMAPTEQAARERAAADTGYPIRDIGEIAHVRDNDGSSRQKTFIFVTSNDVTAHPLYANQTLSQHLQDAVTIDGPVLVFGPELTAGG